MSTENTSNNEVAKRSHQLWDEAGRPAGRDLEFWIKAETEIREASKEQPVELTVATASKPTPAPEANQTAEARGEEPRSRTKPAGKKVSKGAASRTRHA